MTFRKCKNTKLNQTSRWETLVSCLLVLIAAIVACSELVYITPKTELGDIGEPRSSYDLGYAGKAEGRVVIVSFFVDSDDCKWTRNEMKKCLSPLKTACDFIEKQAKKYDKEVEFVYDWNEDPKLLRRRKTGFPVWDNEYFEADFDEKIEQWVNSVVSYDDYLSKYDADSVFTIFYFNTDARAYAICYDGIDIEEESLVAFKSSSAAVYAHEILHLFGAHDFYEEAEYTEDAVKYIRKNYANDIMLTTPSGKNINRTVGKLTAYHLGWLDEVKDIELFPEFER